MERERRDDTSMSDRGRFEHASRVMHHGRHCATCTQFYTEHGVVHPIRSSPGYDPAIEEISARERHRRAREEFYGHERAEKHAHVVERPPWAVGLSDRHLITIARAHGQNAGMPLWWERANLVQGEGELREALRGRSSMDRRVRAAVDVGRKERARPREVHVYQGGGDDLPF